MHEMALSNGVIRILEEAAQAQGFTRVTRVWLEIGALSHAEPSAMEFCFAAATRGTLAEGAILDILRPPGQAWCMDCSVSVELPTRGDPCPQCGGYKLQITGGEDLRVKELEVE